jgi:hypothetical protein
MRRATKPRGFTEDEYLQRHPLLPKGMLTWEQASALRRPRRCHVPWHRQGGAMCCELCTNRYVAPSGQTVHCASADDPPVYRPFPARDRF